MTKQIFKLVWNRKRSNVLIIAEIFFSFLVLFAAVTLCVYYADNYRHPLGFEWRNVWNISISSPTSGSGGSDAKADTPESFEQTRQMLLALRDMPEIEAFGGANMCPFQVGASDMQFNHKGRLVRMRNNWATDGFKDAMSMQLVSGRWFDSSDDAVNFEPVVISQSLARELFGSEDPLGKPVSDPPANGTHAAAAEKQQRVVGVITDFRQHGEFHGLYNYLFYRTRVDNLPITGLPNILIKLRPGTTAAFEEKLMARLRSVARDYTFQIEPLARIRQSHMKLVLAPVIAAALIAGFLIVMVGLGMVGVVSQSVARRTREIGLRRAVGGTANSIYAQILGELFLIASIGLLLGAAVVVQLPLLDLANWLTTKVYGTSIGISLALIYGLTILSGLYPSWMATRVQPADVLRYE